MSLTDTRADNTHLEYYSSRPMQAGQFRRWFPLDRRRGEESSSELLLLRERSGGHTLRHFMGTCHGMSLVREAPLNCDLVRLQMGMEMAAGVTTRLQGRRIGTHLRLRLTRPIPRAERRLLTAVCEITQNEKTTEMVVPGYAERTCCRVLSDLGFEIEASNV